MLVPQGLGHSSASRCREDVENGTHPHPRHFYHQLCRGPPFPALEESGLLRVQWYVVMNNDNAAPQ